VAALKAELQTEAHFATLRKARIRELHEDLGKSELEKRQLKIMLSATIEKHEASALELRATQGMMKKLMDVLDRQRLNVGKYESVERSLRKEITELRLLAECAHRCHDEQTAALRKQLEQADAALLADYAARIEDGSIQLCSAILKIP
jgi:hypothetical protein